MQRNRNIANAIANVAISIAARCMDLFDDELTNFAVEIIFDTPLLFRSLSIFATLAINNCKFQRLY
jgi:hypothetical protein